MQVESSVALQHQYTHVKSSNVPEMTFMTKFLATVSTTLLSNLQSEIYPDIWNRETPNSDPRQPCSGSGYRWPPQRAEGSGFLELLDMPWGLMYVPMSRDGCSPTPVAAEVRVQPRSAWALKCDAVLG